jgi:Flp pilus assembly pilin Flp
MATRGSRLLRDQRGATATEYVLVVALVALASSGAFLALGVALADNFTMARAYVLYPVP